MYWFPGMPSRQQVSTTPSSKEKNPGLLLKSSMLTALKNASLIILAKYVLPLGVPEILRSGTDVTVVTYGAMCPIVLESAEKLSQAGIEVEVIDVQSLLPFDRHGIILESLKKTSRILFTDEDVPGGTTAFMMAEVIENAGGYFWLDSPPKTLPAKAHRPATGRDGDYWSKPNAEDVFDAVYEMMHEADPASYPEFYK